MAELPLKIVSGGQTGADRAGLDFAIEQSVEHGGWCPAGRRSEDGPIDSRYNLKETPNYGYEQRTEWNVRDSDATILFNRGSSLSAGTALTLRFCQRMERPFTIVRVPVGSDDAAIEHAACEVAEMLVRHGPTTLNIAGNRERTTPGITQFVRSVLASAWAKVPSMQQEVMPQHVQGALFGDEMHRPGVGPGRKGRR